LDREFSNVIWKSKPLMTQLEEKFCTAKLKENKLRLFDPSNLKKKPTSVFSSRGRWLLHFCFSMCIHTVLMQLTLKNVTHQSHPPAVPGTPCVLMASQIRLNCPSGGAFWNVS
jgi:hypothetical protein